MSTTPMVRKVDQLPEPVIGMLQTVIPDCGTLLPDDITLEQFRAALWLELTGRQTLHGCSVASLRECTVKAATYGLLPGRDCHFLPFSERGSSQKKATYVPNYMGILRTLYRTGQVEHAFAEVVYSNDIFDLDYGRTPALIHKPPRKQRGVGEGAYGLIQLRDSTRPLVHYMDPDDLDRVRKKSPAHEQGPWVTDPNEMKRKTAMKNVAKYAPLTPLAQQLLQDEDARVLEDIPQERHERNLIDVSGDQEAVALARAAARHGAPTVVPAIQPSAWRDIIQMHGHLATGDLAIQVQEALTIPTYSEVAGNKLAMILADLANA